MTILVKANTAGKNPTGVALVPLVGQRPVKKSRKATGQAFPMRLKKKAAAMVSGLVLSLVAVLLALSGGALLFREYLRAASVRYRGTCAISSTYNEDYIVLNDALPKPWFGVPAGQLKVYSSPSDIIDTKILSQILEDMAIEDRMETITVRDGQRAFEIIHDFDDNLTSIQSDERCFIMDMIREFVLEPSSLIAGFRNESALELSHAHSVFRARLPPLPRDPRDPRDHRDARRCDAARPVYRLDLEDNLVLRKRSVTVSTIAPQMATEELRSDNATEGESPKHDFVQFSGKHLQRITISNMDDILKYEITNMVNVHPKLRVAV